MYEYPINLSLVQPDSDAGRFNHFLTYIKPKKSKFAAKKY